ncbi:MAG: FtsX-like permease family protein [Lachnospiraceae bacterium]|nr:FtsX-like permease family protein [Lachnospiraceae bacterium]
MRGISVFTYSIKQGIVSLKKNRMFTLASIGTVTACLFLFGIFYFAISNFQHLIHTAESSVGISVFFQEGISEDAIQSIGSVIQGRPEVDHVEYISAEEAWERFKADNFQDSPDLVESFQDDNPLKDSASYEIYLKNIEQQDTLVEYLETVEGVREVKRSDEVAGSLSSINKLVGGVSIALILVLLLVSVFLIHSTIATGITVRKPEIAIMRLMGASDYFIWAPFIVEGILIGLIGSILPLLLLVASYGRIVSYLSEKFSFFAGTLSFLRTGEVFSILVPVSLMVGVGIGFLGSFITVRRNLNI